MADAKNPQTPTDIFVGADPHDAVFDDLDALVEEARLAEKQFFDDQKSTVEIEDETPADPPKQTPETPPAETPPEEGDDDAVTVEEPPAEDPAEKKDRSIRIPKSRLDKEVARRREIERQLAELQTKLNPPAPKADAAPSFSEDDVELMFDAVMDGKGKVAREKFAEILGKVVENTVQRTLDQVPERAVDAVRSANVRETLDQTIERLETAYPVLDSRAEDFDPLLTETVLGMQRGLMAKDGLAPAEALERSVERAIKMMRPDLLEDEVETPAEVAEKPTDEKPAEDPAQKAREERVQKSLQAKIDLANKQPARNSQPANRTDPAKSIDIETLTEDELESLPDSVLRQLRGDALK